MLLGGFLLDSDDVVVQEQFGVVRDDQLERIYYWLRTMQMYTFRVKFKDENSYYIASRKAEESLPCFDKNGLLQDGFTIKLRCTAENGENKEDRWFDISRVC